MNKLAITLLTLSAFMGGVSACWIYIHQTPEPCRTISLQHLKAAAIYGDQLSGFIQQRPQADFLTELTRKR
jgi:cyclic lactone autoinducer peptide